MNEIERIKALSNAFGPSGMEDNVIALVREECSAFHCEEDHMRNLYIYSSTSNTKQEKPVIHLDAHGDEVGFIIQAIRQDGMLRFLPLGGWEAKNIVGNSVLIRNVDGEIVQGIVCSKPPHFMKQSEKGKAIAFDDLLIDVGATSLKEVQESYRIQIGCFAVPNVLCSYDERHDIFMGKAFDCRIGCAALIETMHQVQNMDVAVQGTISAQEEVGERGMKCAIQNIHCDVMIAFEGCPADDTFEESYMIQSALRKGPMLRHFDCSMITNPRFQRFALDVAKRHHIPVQESVRSGGGTNGAISHTHLRGIPTIVIGIPVRYAHSSYGYTTLKDYQNAVKLAVAIIKDLTKEMVASF